MFDWFYLLHGRRLPEKLEVYLASNFVQIAELIIIREQLLDNSQFEIPRYFK